MQVQSVFRVLECPHDGQPMFSSEYKRSNRTRMSKILRCFPHCCPTHRPRSYCGSALHVHVTLIGDDSEEKEGEDNVSGDDEQQPLWKLDVLSPAQALSDFVVFGRFEVHDPDDPLRSELRLGQHVRASDITENRDPDVIWVPGGQATSQRALELAEGRDSGPSRVFVLNEGDGESHHWEYDWRSGTSQRKRASQHKFRAYVFLPDVVDPSMWQVVAITSSTPFTLSSYRKQDDDDYEGGGELSLIQELSAVVTSGGILQPPPSAAPVNEIMLLRQNQLVVRDTTKLAVVINLLSVIDVSWVDGDVLASHVVSILRTNPDTATTSLAQYPALDQELHQYATSVVLPCLTALRAASPPPTSDAWLTKWSGLLQLCVDMFCQLIKDGTLAELQALVRRASRVQTITDAQAITSFVDFAAELARHTELVVRQLSGHASLDLLVDDIVSCLFEEDPEFEWVPRFTREEALRLLRNTSLLGLDSYREQLRLCAAATIPTPGLQSEVSRLFTGTWCCTSADTSSSLSLPAPPQDFGFSALTAIQILTAAQRIDMIMDADATALRVRTNWSFFSELWSSYVLDGRQYAAALLPNGLSTSIWNQLGAGSIVGDYRGGVRQAEDGSIVLDLDVFVYSVNAPSYFIQIAMVPAVSSGESPLQLLMHVRVYRSRFVAEAQVVRRDELSLMAPTQRSALVDFTADDLLLAATMVYEQTP